MAPLDLTHLLPNKIEVGVLLAAEGVAEGVAVGAEAEMVATLGEDLALQRLVHHPLEASVLQVLEVVLVGVEVAVVVVTVEVVAVEVLAVEVAVEAAESDRHLREGLETSRSRRHGSQTPSKRPEWCFHLSLRMFCKRLVTIVEL